MRTSILAFLFWGWLGFGQNLAVQNLRHCCEEGEKHRKHESDKGRYLWGNAALADSANILTRLLLTVRSLHGRLREAPVGLRYGDASRMNDYIGNQLNIFFQTLHARHRPPPGHPSLEVPARLEMAGAALHKARFSEHITWHHASDSALTSEAASAALKLVHTSEHLRRVQEMSQLGGGFDSDTYCAPGSWEAMLDGTIAWLDAASMAAAGEGPALALARPAGHHVTKNVAMGFGLVNFAAAAVAAQLEKEPLSQVSILDWDVHHGNGIAAIFKDEPRVRYSSLHQAGLFPGTGMNEEDLGPNGNLFHLPLSADPVLDSDHFLRTLRERALPFLLNPSPRFLLISAGYDALESDPLASMSLTPGDFHKAIQLIVDEFKFPRERIAVGLEGGYSLDLEHGMPAGLVETCSALLQRRNKTIQEL